MLQGVFAQVSRMVKELFPRNQTIRWPKTMSEDAVPAAKRARTEEEGSSNEENSEGEGRRPGQPEVTATEQQQTARVKRRKCILLLSYNGKGYLGMQLNPGVRTIEEDLLDALCKAEAFPEDMRDNLGKLGFQRCARTDKGVSAVRQVVSLKIKVSLIEKTNAFLPDQIHVMGLKRVTRGFNSKAMCSARTYEYLLPTYAFAPFRLTTLDYRIDDDTLGRVKSLLQQYVGTHNFHNFTSRRPFEEASSRRFIMSFECGEPFLERASCSTCREGREAQFVSLYVKGQSFVLHQIRKMIGLVIAVVRGYTPEDTITRAYRKGKIDIPRAPSLGLMLENVHFDGYNKRHASDGSHDPLKWEEYQEKIETFKKEHIHRNIIDTEINELSMMHWLNTLQMHNFHQTELRLQQQQAIQTQAQATDTQTTQIDPQASKDDPQASKDDPPASKDDPQASKDDPPASKDDPQASKDDPQASKDDPPASKDDPQASKDDPQASKDDPQASKDDPQASMDDPQASKDDPPASKDDPQASKDELESTSTSSLLEKMVTIGGENERTEEEKLTNFQ